MIVKDVSRQSREEDALNEGYARRACLSVPKEPLHANIRERGYSTEKTMPTHVPVVPYHRAGITMMMPTCGELDAGKERVVGAHVRGMAGAGGILAVQQITVNVPHWRALSILHDLTKTQMSPQLLFGARGPAAG